MDGQLREVLREERDETHQFTKHKRLSKEVEGIVDAEGVNHGGQEHVLTNEGCETGVLEIGLVEHAALPDRLQKQVEKHDEWEDQVQDGEGQRRDRPVDILRPALHDQVHKADIQECICSCNDSHEQLNEVPLVELEETGLFKQLLDAQNHDDLPNGTENDIGCVEHEQPEAESLVRVLARVLQEQVWGCKYDEIVDQRPPVELLFDSWHHDCLDFSNRISIVFESESLMLVMN